MMGELKLEAGKTLEVLTPLNRLVGEQTDERESSCLLLYTPGTSMSGGRKGGKRGQRGSGGPELLRSIIY